MYAVIDNLLFGKLNSVERVLQSDNNLMMGEMVKRCFSIVCSKCRIAVTFTDAYNFSACTSTFHLPESFLPYKYKHESAVLTIILC